MTLAIPSDLDIAELDLLQTGHTCRVYSAAHMYNYRYASHLESTGDLRYHCLGAINPANKCKNFALKPTHNALHTQAWSPSPCSHTIPRDRASEFTLNLANK